MKTFKERLQWAIDRQSISMTELAKRAGVTRGALYQWLDETTLDHKASVLLRISSLLRVSPYWLEFGQGKPDAGVPALIDPSVVAFVLRFAETLHKYPIGHRMTLDDKIRAVLALWQDGHGTIDTDHDVTATATQILLEMLPEK